MTIETESDRADLLKELGELVSVGSYSDVPAILDREFLQELEFPGGSSTEPVAYIQSIYPVNRSDLLKRCDGTTFTVREIEPDGTGMTLLRLRNG